MGIDENTMLRKSNQKAEDMGIQCRHLEDRVKNLEAEHKLALRDKDDEIRRLNETSAKDRRRVAKRITQLESTLEELRHSAARNSVAREGPRMVEASRLEQITDRLSKGRRTWKAEKEALQKQVAEVEEEKKVRRRDCLRLEKVVETLHESNETLQRQPTTQDGQIDDLRAQIARLQSQRTCQADSETNLHAEIGRLREEYATQEGEIAKLRRELDAAQAVASSSKQLATRTGPTPTVAVGPNDPPYIPMLHQDILKGLPTGLVSEDRAAKIDEIRARPRPKQRFRKNGSVDPRIPHTHPVRYRRPARKVQASGLTGQRPRADAPRANAPRASGSAEVVPASRALPPSPRVVIPHRRRPSIFSSSDDESSASSRGRGRTRTRGGKHLSRDEDEEDSEEEDNSEREGSDGDEEPRNAADEYGDESDGAPNVVRNGNLREMFEERFRLPKNLQPTTTDGRFTKLAFGEVQKTIRTAPSLDLLQQLNPIG